MRSSLAIALVALVVAVVGVAGAQPVSPPTRAPGAPNPEDLLRNFVVEGEIPVQPLPKIGVVP
ncbi:MAG: hypothetical protein RIF41_06595 [Polyangiaceae bacterium]